MASQKNTNDDYINNIPHHDWTHERILSGLGFPLNNWFMGIRMACSNVCEPDLSNCNGSIFDGIKNLKCIGFLSIFL